MMNRKASDDYQLNESRKDRMLKKCGHERGYKCSCNARDTTEQFFDVIDEMKFSKHRLNSRKRSE